ncbi:protein-L-isoaspartate(D-aspartate) O-methyltransferase [Actinoalloteichus hoggarensis]|uniref:Protein-L-isoaspartate O-methyltransferase n=1 Tax=Actinoalloteichus hoggarensis TaxID=1470176 RepID=A0A221VXU8_9PSEU|nr:class I SAM-dependent methyltransferase [Actinoalloteichus hoggarensis]ASO18323.1 Protein-L-isoaspartate O-methyltransferase [Actinoalloteichus hoggarensis]MBB5921686.1 protein-L-isoaspartate(D-aspartate) O-methyltransferase [Actinoalloteichus hoggarensis]
MPETLQARLAEFAASLRAVGAIRSHAVEHAFAAVARHRCVPRFRYGPETITVPQDELPGDQLLDIVYSHRSLLTSIGQDGRLPSSSSAPTLMARMLEALDLRSGMRVLEIGAGTGYNAALITTITGAPVVTVDAGAATAQGAAESIHRLGLGDRVTVVDGDGYRGELSGGPYDRVVVTCGVAGFSPHWFDQLAPGGLVLAPVAHGGVHPVLAATRHADTVVATAALWADFMPAAGPLRPAELAGGDPADYVPPAPVTRILDASPARTQDAYNDLWFFLATRDPGITRAYMADDSVDTTTGACALRSPHGTAWVHIDGSITATGRSSVAEDLRALIREWSSAGRPALTRFSAVLDRTETAEPLWTTTRWNVETNAADSAACTT